MIFICPEVGFCANSDNATEPSHAMVLGAYKMKLGDAKTDTEKHVYNRAYLVITGGVAAESDASSNTRATVSNSSGALTTQARGVVQLSSTAVSNRIGEASKQQRPQSQGMFENLPIITPSRSYESYVGKKLGLIDYVAGPQTELWNLSIAPNDKSLLLASADGVYKWDISSGKIVKKLEQHKGGDTYGCDISSDGRFAVTSGGEGDIVYLDYINAKKIEKLSAHEGRVNSIKFSPNGMSAISVGVDARILKWEFSSNSCRQIGEIESVDRFGKKTEIYDVQITKDGNHAVILLPLTRIQIWDIHKGSLVSDHQEGGLEIVADT